MVKKDAWRQLHDLLERYTKEWLVRQDLQVTAHATNRCVEFGLGKRCMTPMGVEMWSFDHSTKRNVSTMRELAQALLDACDFVDAANPEWSSH